MRQIFDFMKTTVVGGAIFLLPFAAVFLVVIKAGKMAVDSATPLAEKLPISKGEAVVAVYVVGIFLLVLVAFAAGLFVRSFKIEKDAASFLEDKVLNKLPPYVALRKYADRLAGLEAKTHEDLKPVLARMNNGWRLGFLVDAFNDGQVAVFMPGAPDPSSGVVQIVSADHIVPLDISCRDALACLAQSGRGLSTLLARSSFKKQKSERRRSPNSRLTVGPEWFCRKLSLWRRDARMTDWFIQLADRTAALDAIYLSRTTGPCGSCA